jgi:hypothetical protein
MRLWPVLFGMVRVAAVDDLRCNDCGLLVGGIATAIFLTSFYFNRGQVGV